MGDDLTSFDFSDFRSNKCGGVTGTGNIIKFSAAISNQPTSEISLGDADGELIGEGGEDGFCYGFAVRVKVDRLRCGFWK